MQKFKYALGIITLLIFHSVIFAQSFELKVDSLLKEKYKPNSPGAVFLVAHNGNTIYEKAFGSANMELKTPMKSENVFGIGSITKQFTSVSILMLLEEGKLNLDDEITKYIPDYPTKEKTITIHHLLTHTSGIKNYTSMRELRDILKKDLTPMELINFFKNEPMDFSPGEKYKYNNSGYIILGYIIESLSGMSYSDFVEEKIFKKIGMTSSSYGNHNKIIMNRASGYSKREGYTNAMQISYSLPYASGSLLSNTEDMLKWQYSLNKYTLVSKSTLEKAYTNYRLNNGSYINYGFGWFIKEINKHKSIEHGGSIPGFQSMAVYIPEENIYVIGLTNCDCYSPTKITRKIAEIFLNKLKDKS